MNDPDATMQLMLVTNGLSVFGAIQVVTGQPVVDANDRNRIRELLHEAIFNKGKKIYKPR